MSAVSDFPRVYSLHVCFISSQALMITITPGVVVSVYSGDADSQRHEAGYKTLKSQGNGHLKKITLAGRGGPRL